MKAQDYQISAEKFVFRSTGENIHDKKLETKPVTYFQDALHRFAKNKGSILAFGIIVILVLFAIITPILSPFQVSYNDSYYRFVQPKNQLFYDLGIPFWDGGTVKEVNKLAYDQYLAIQIETGRKVIMNEPTVVEEIYMGKASVLYNFRLDTYNAVGVQFADLSTKEYKALHILG